MMLIVFEPGTGRIEAAQFDVATNDLVKRYRDMGKGAILIQDRIEALDEFYVAGNKVRRRPELTARVKKRRIRADGKDAAVVYGIPLGAQVQIWDGVSGQMIVADGTGLEFTTSIPGKYRIWTEPWPAMPWSCEIEAV